ncbi:DNA cytosine methyltransferase [Arsukibacterium sp.]|uniref:DNA cytosine methyltransferase n=1 Tax=Arsukibacterium sp. TaxID=1977258 RepID=UPI00299E3F4A|nr:DNA cytosine methyltransferase [Arsukibacterium sp.]MDX1538859.1 DNA cytosine methyltransferase [Arsukibacterium sp.]
MRGLIVDNFAGGGGASTGIEMAIGRSVDIAINHDKDAIAMHTINHPGTLHYCESVFDVDPVKATAGRPVDLAWFSPDCKHFSKAKGGKPVSREIRGLAYIAIRWAMKVHPRVIMLENVEEFKTWGPLIECPDTGNSWPCPERKTETFKAFVAMLSTGVDADHPALQECADVLGLVDTAKLIRGLGYKVEWRELRACDYGAPTIRKRLFMVARCDGQPIVWPEPTHGAPDSPAVLAGKMLPYRTAAECIDWSIPCPSIFERKRPLAENTMRRIAKGIQRFVIDAAQPFIVTCNHSGDHFRGQGLDKPFNTVLASRDAHGLVVPTLTPFITEHANATHQRNMPANEPLRTVCAEVKGGHFALVAPVIARQFGKSVGHPVTEPSGSITAGGGGKSQLVAAFMTKFQQNSIGQSPAEQFHTVMAGATRFGLATSHLVKLRGTCKDGQPVTEPMPTITSGGNHVGEVRAFLLKYYGTNIGHPLQDPLQTVTTKHRFGLVTVQGEQYEIVDIGMRMLEPHELFAAQGFPADYVINVDQNGKPIPKAKQVARCGNAVPPPFAEALVRANLPELCADKAGAAA